MVAIEITPNDTLRGWTYSFCAFSRRDFTHTVFPLCVYPATIHVKGCCKTAVPAEISKI
jgi:hypothetical protein